MDRRSLLNVVLAAGGAVASAVVGLPALVAALAPGLRVRRSERWQSLGPTALFPAGEVTEAHAEIPRDDSFQSLRQRLVYVWHSGEGFVVYSRNCTDLSCPVVWDRGSKCFFCPCHGGIFSQTGNPMAGPPPEPLYRYANRVRGEELEIDLSSVPPIA